MWNDTDSPLAYLITFRTYGSWLHGDKRGSVNRYRNTFGTTYLPEEKAWLRINEIKLKSEPVILDSKQRTIVEASIRETCEFRCWQLLAINVRTNHVHTVAAIGGKTPGTALNAFKANATRKMREDGCWTLGHSPWSERGSERYLWNEGSVERAIEYVIDGQGGELPKGF
ncbi:MAG: hypothetical protein ABI791_03455 [Acidobacteriota bacterium]